MVTKQVFICLLTQRKTETSIFTGFVLGEYKRILVYFHPHIMRMLFIIINNIILVQA